MIIIMKIIISHDVDHLYWSERFLKKLCNPKWLIKENLLFMLGKIDFSQYRKRMKKLFEGKVHNIPELVIFNKLHKVPATFFVGVKNGLGMMYSFEEARKIISFIQEKGFDIGVHGIAFDNEFEIKKEFELFNQIKRNKEIFGIRNHYLRFCKNTLLYQSKAGYNYDSTIYGIKNPYKENGIWEFPICIMDSYVISDSSKNDIKKIKNYTIKQIKDAEKNNIRVFTILFHDYHYTEIFNDYKIWYEWLIIWLKERFEFIDFKTAVKDNIEYK